jgi:hypothetical protein
MGMDVQINVMYKLDLLALIGLELFQDVEETTENDICNQSFCLFLHIE